jgi:LysW-gamma-L-alpha-aminoadipyl-6-phosphate/LysW-L-glutamyl-5-phosphate reductase
VTSLSHLGEYVYQQHPNLRKRTTLKFSAPDAWKPVMSLPGFSTWREPAADWHSVRKLAPRIIDLSADFRVRDPQCIKQYYSHDHQSPDGWHVLFMDCLSCIGRN